MKTTLIPFTLAAFALAFLAGPVAGQTTTPGLTATDYQMKIANLERIVQSLRDENAALKKALVAATQGTAAAATTVATTAAPATAAVTTAAPAPVAIAKESAAKIERSALIQAEIEKETALQASIAEKMTAQEAKWNAGNDPFGKKGIGTSEADKNKLRADVTRALAESRARVAAHEAALRTLATQP